MKKTIAIAMIVVGGAMMAYTGFTFVTREKVVDVGPVQITKDKNHLVIWSPILGGVILFAGLVVLFAEKKGKA